MEDRKQILQKKIRNLTILQSGLINDPKDIAIRTVINAKRLTTKAEEELSKMESLNNIV